MQLALFLAVDNSVCKYSPCSQFMQITWEALIRTIWGKFVFMFKYQIDMAGIECPIIKKPIKFMICFVEQ